jgi:pSer/pThr/pTyr-binding forkhead associated (FHA) protein
LRLSSSGGWTFENLGNSATVFVNGRMIDKEKEIRNGDVILIGPFTINTMLEEVKKDEPKNI